MRSNLLNAVGILAVGLLIAGCGAASQTASPASATTPVADPSAPIASVTTTVEPVDAGPVLPRPVATSRSAFAISFGG